MSERRTWNIHGVRVPNSLGSLTSKNVASAADVNVVPKRHSSLPPLSVLLNRSADSTSMDGRHYRQGYSPNPAPLIGSRMGSGKNFFRLEHQGPIQYPCSLIGPSFKTLGLSRRHSSSVGIEMPTAVPGTGVASKRSTHQWAIRWAIHRLVRRGLECGYYMLDEQPQEHEASPYQRRPI
ncbi:hypothetical protein NMY22_g15221 [Coprinellus aureogranulatus]|nr:hypothetical protein NMY22_g15221 [Coprinellus aureogranulatus]